MGNYSRHHLIKIKLLQHNLTQRDIAKALDVTEAYVSMLVKGKRKSEDFNVWVSVNLGIAGYGHNKGKSIVSDEYFEYFKSLYLKERGPSIKSCWRTVLGYAKRKYGVQQKDFPSLFSFKRRLKFEIPEQAIYLARYGEAAWNRKYALYVDRDYSNVLAGECWVSDHAQLDVMVFDENGNPTCPWVTVWRDFKTSKWLAWELYCGNPNSDRIFQTFFHSALKYGRPDSVYIDNGKDYRAKDFAGGRSSCDIKKAQPMLKLIGVKVRFALPYNAQTKPVERDFLKIKEMLSRHLQGFRGGNVTERPSKLKDEIKNQKLLKFADFKNLFDDFIENALNKMPSNGKNLKGKSPNQLWSEEFKIKNVIARDELKLFCIKTSRTFAITRNGVRDGEIQCVNS
jgi:transcriptional regulator with XRE-family HTH domain